MLEVVKLECSKIQSHKIKEDYIVTGCQKHLYYGCSVKYDFALVLPVWEHVVLSPVSLTKENVPLSVQMVLIEANFHLKPKLKLYFSDDLKANVS